MRHWRALDGLRGIAILLVMGEHFRLPGFEQSGQVGVTLFFSLSGFLITSLLLADWAQAGRISFGTFYLRRAMRLLPALLLMLAIIGPLMAATGHDWLQATLSALLYYANWAQVISGQLPVIGHTWTLSIEEQFYIVWPALLLLMLVTLKGSRWPIVVLCGAALLVMAWRAVLWQPTGDGYFRVFYGSDTRADALLLGCALAFAFSRGVVPPPKWLVGAAVASGVLFVTTTSFGFMAVIGLGVVAVASTVLVAASAGRVGGLLEWAPLVWTGTNSYSLYLWHVPILSLLRDGPLGDSVPTTMIALLLSVAAAAASRYLVELPILRLRPRATPVVQPAAGFGG
jgi:peptidoglycan/LPS O-acetylase OafA/YrhL